MRSESEQLYQIKNLTSFTDGQSEQNLLFLNEECRFQLGEAVSIYSGVQKAVLDGSIEVGVLWLILKNKESFLMLSKHSDQSVIPESGMKAIDKRAVLAKILEWRNEELETYKRVLRQVAHLDVACQVLRRGK